MAASRRTRRRKLILVWSVVVAGWGLAMIGQALLLTAFRGVAMTATTVLAAALGGAVTRRVLARDREPPITVWDLRRR